MHSKKLILKHYFVLAIFLSFSSLKAQNIEVGLLAGLSQYSGDLSPNQLGFSPKDLNLAFGVFGRANLVKAFSVRLGANFTQLSADDADNTNGSNKNRGFNFRSNVLEAQLLLEWNILRLQMGSSRLIPYVFGGGAFYTFSPEARLEDNFVELQPLGTEGQGLDGYAEPYSLSQFNIPFGAGIKLDLNESLIVGFELSGRKLFTDYIDDVSDTVVNYADILNGNGPLAAQFSNPQVSDTDPTDFVYTRGGEFNDWYFFGNLTLSFRLGNSGGLGGNGKALACPKF